LLNQDKNTAFPAGDAVETKIEFKEYTFYVCSTHIINIEGHAHDTV